MSDAAFRMMLYMAERCTAVEQSEAERISEWLKEHGVQSLDIVFSGRMEAVYARFAAREQSPERSAAHQVHGLNNLTSFERATLPLLVFQTGSQREVVDATDFGEVDFVRLSAVVKAFLSENLPAGYGLRFAQMEDVASWMILVSLSQKSLTRSPAR